MDRKQFPTFIEEKKLWEKGYTHVIGMDEVGRGAFAGPVVVGAVVFDAKTRIDGTGLEDVRDSKLLNGGKRKLLSKLIKKYCKFWAIEQMEVGVINRVGIGKATQMAFRKVVKKLKIKNAKRYVLIDGFYVKYIRGIGVKNQKAIIKGDGKSISIAAASIIAKVYRDKLMTKLHKKFRKYGFNKHKGYGTKQHQLAIEKYGLSKTHRKSFNLSRFQNQTLPAGPLRSETSRQGCRIKFGMTSERFHSLLFSNICYTTGHGKD